MKIVTCSPNWDCHSNEGFNHFLGWTYSGFDEYCRTVHLQLTDWDYDPI